MNILFLGGNRFFGKKLLKKISKEKKYKIFIINRGNRKIEKDILGKLNVKLIKCDRKDETKLRRKLKNLKFDVIFDNCAYHLNDIKILINLIYKNCNPTYIFSSTVMSYLNIYLKKKRLDENDWYKAKSTRNMIKIYKTQELKYAKNKRKIENFLIKNKKIKYIILRIHNVIGKFDFSNKTFKLFNTNFDQLKNYNFNEEDLLQFTYDEDLVKILYKFFNREQSHSDIYNICNDPIKVKHFLRKKDKLLKNKTKNIDDKKFPFPRNVIMANHKIKKKLNFKFTPTNKIIYRISKSSEFK